MFSTFIKINIVILFLLKVSFPLDRVHAQHPCISSLHHRGITGKGVAIGIIDRPVDFTKNDFRNSDGSTRFLNVPLNNCGHLSREWIDSILDAGFPYDSFNPPLAYFLERQEIHGTLVTSISAGNGQSVGYNGTRSGIKGMAPEASLIYNPVHTIDSIASANNMPYVINNSLYADLFFLKEVPRYFGRGKKGKALVSAAGNFASKRYGEFAMQKGDTSGVILDFEYDSTYTGTGYLSGSQKFPAFSLKYTGDYSDLTICLTADFGGTKGLLDSTICVNFMDMNYEKKVINENSDSLWFYFSQDSSYHLNSNYLNDSYEIDIRIYEYKQAGLLPGAFHLGFKRSSHEKTDTLVLYFGNTVSAVQPSYIFGKYRPDPKLTPYHTLPVGLYYDSTAIVVGGYMHRTEEKQIYWESSRGPNYYGHTRPDIVAPAIDVYSLVPYGGTAPDSIHGYYGGTSVAAPFVTGLVALMLQQNPELDQEDIREILRSEAIQDDVTGYEPNNDFGWGRLNFDALCDCIVDLDKYVPKAQQKKAVLNQNYPNPFRSSTSFRYYIPWGTRKAGITVYDVSGRIVKRLSNLRHEKEFRTFRLNAEDNASGVYFTRLVCDDIVITRKAISVK
jgi:hypothetical protein